MAQIIDLPDFMINHIDLNNVSKIKKIYLFFKGLLIGYLHKNTNKSLFCLVMNIFFKKSGKIFYEEGFYGKITDDSSNIYFPNKRIDRLIVNYKNHLNHLFKSYCLEEITFFDNDLIVDCGSNVGELYLAFKQKNLNVKYIGFEPDDRAYECLLKNIDLNNNNIHNLALSNKNKKEKLFLDTYGANTSLVDFGSSETVQVETRTLDSFEITNIKLLKIDAEGFELEVLEGAKQTLKNVEYVSVDFGPERGIDETKTMTTVIPYLLINNFEFIHTFKGRDVGLFKNKKN